jgi:polysaccharide biosynthesis/export protein
MRISLIALSAVSTLIGYQSLQTKVGPSQSTVPKGQSEGKRDHAQAPALAKLPAVPSLAAPESLANQQFMSNRAVGKYLVQQGDMSRLGGSAAGQLNLLGNLSPDLLNRLVDLPAPPQEVSQTVRVPAAAVDNLPIDQFVAASLQSEVPLSQSRPTSAAPVTSPPAVGSETGSFSDTNHHPAATAIAALVQQGVMQGFPDGTFRPNAAITDREFKIVMQKALNKQAAAVADLTLPSQVVSRADAATFAYQKMQTMAAIGNQTNSASSNSASSNLASSNSKIAAADTANGNQNSSEVNGQLVAFQPTDSAEQTKQLAKRSNPNLSSVSTVNREPDAYTLGAGDRIRVDVFNVPEYSKEYQVLVDGTVNLYRIGDVSVAGMTLKQAEALLTTRYDRLVKRTLVDVSLITPRPLNLAIAGEVGRPGSYTVTAEGNKFPTITRLIQLAGGMTQAADPRQVQVRRPQLFGAEQVIGIDLWELFQTGNLRQDLILRDGDSIFIGTRTDPNLAEAAQLAAANFATDPSQPLNIALVGEVARPGPYLMKGGTTSVTTSAGTTTVAGGLPTVTQAIQNAGGITQLADIRKVEVRRTTRSGQPQIIALNLWALVQGGDISQDIGLQQGDTIVIPKATALTPQEVTQLATASFSPKTIRVNVVGETVRPGAVEVPPNTPLNQALLAAGGFNREAHKKSVQLVRLNPNGTVSQRTVTIDFARGIDEQGNPLLLNNDIVIVGRSGAAKFSDALGTVLGPLLRFLPFRSLF